MKKQNLFMRKSIMALAFLVTSLLAVNAQTPVEKYGRLQVKTENGKAYVGAEDGTLISLAGNSLFWSSFVTSGGKFYRKDVVDHLAQNWKTQIVRAAMGVEEADPGQGYISNPNGAYNKVKTVIDAAIDNDIYVIVDYHTHYGENYQSQAITFFTQIAKEYGTNPHIIYEIYNEPLGDDPDNGKVKTPWSVVKNYADDVIKAIRVEDPDNLIIVGTSEWSQRVDEAADSPLRIDNQPDPNLAYTLHFYANSHKQWLRDRGIRAMEDNIPLFVTEWGSVDASGNGGYNPGETQLWLDWMKENHISHANWSVSDKDETASIIQANQGVDGLLENKVTTPGNLIKNLTETRFQEQGLTLSTENFNLNGEQISLFPNPATDIITLETSKTNITSVQLVDMQGREVLNNSYSDLKASIDVSSLAKGIYILNVNNKASMQVAID